MAINPTWPVNGEKPWGNKLRDGLDEIVDEVNAQGDIIESGRLSEASLNAAYATRSPFAEVFRALDQRDSSGFRIAVAGDSTSDNATEGVEVGIKDACALLWPERPVRRRGWSGSSWGSYSSVQSGAVTDPAAVLMRDGFDSTLSEVVGASPAAGGNVYGGNEGVFRTSGGNLLCDAGGSQAYLFGRPIARDTADFELTFKLSATLNTANGKAVIPMAFFGSGENPNTATWARVRIVFTTSTTAPTLKAQIREPGGADTDLHTFTVGNSVTDLVCKIILSGTKLKFVVGTQEYEHTLTSGQQTALAAGIIPTLFATPETAAQVDYWELKGQKAYTSSLGNLSIDNGSAAGQRARYQIDRVATMYPERPDLLIINHGHNYGSDTPATFLAEVQELVDAMEAMYGGSFPVAITSQNPEYSPASNAPAANTRMAAVKAYAEAKGWGYIPTFEAFAQRPDGGRALVKLDDGVHPTQDGGVGSATGGRVWADTFKRWIVAHSRRAA